MYFSESDLELLKNVRDNKPKRRKEKRKITKKQQGLDKYHNKKEQTPIIQMQGNMIKNMDENSHFSSSSKPNEERKTKEDIRIKGSIELDGIIGEETRKTYIKRAKTFIRYCVKNFETKTLDDIKPHMVGDFLKSKIDSGLKAKAVGSYKNGIQKMAQSNVKAGILSHKDLVNDHHQEMIPIARKEDRVRNRKKDGTTTTLREARIMAKQAYKISPLHGVMLDLLIEVGPRISELQKIKWEHFDFGMGHLSMDEKNMNKNGRPRWYNEISDKTMGKIEEVYNSGLFSNPNETIFRSNIGNERKIRDVVKDCARNGKVANCALHAFRSVAVEFHTNRLKREGITFEQQVDGILYHVGDDPKLNPEVPKGEPKKIQRIDEETGKPMFYKNGNPIMTTAKKENGKLEYEPVIDPVTGKQVVGPRFVKEELTKRRPQYIRNLYISQLLGHNRPDFSSAYKS